MIEIWVELQKPIIWLKLYSTTKKCQKSRKTNFFSDSHLEVQVPVLPCGRENFGRGSEREKRCNWPSRVDSTSNRCLSVRVSTAEKSVEILIHKSQMLDVFATVTVVARQLSSRDNDYDGSFQEYKSSDKVRNNFSATTFKFLVCEKYLEFWQTHILGKNHPNRYLYWTIIGPQLYDSI